MSIAFASPLASLDWSIPYCIEIHMFAHWAHCNTKILLWSFTFPLFYFKFHTRKANILLLDEAIAFRAIFVIASGPDGRRDGQRAKMLLEPAKQLQNDKRSRPLCANEQLIGTHGRAIE